jgi:predicted RNA-binding Zn ribbon-like protein
MRSLVTGRELPILGGAVCLDFVNTIDPRFKSPREEFLPTFEKLAEWGRYVGLLTPSERRSMLAAGAADPLLAADVHRRAIELRESLYDLFRRPHAASAEALGIFNRELERAAGGLALEGSKGGYRLTGSGAAHERLLGAITRSAAELLTSPELERVRECAGDRCGWLFLDTSKANRRRWCSMAVCGNRANAQRHRRRTRAPGESIDVARFGKDRSQSRRAAVVVDPP